VSLSWVCLYPVRMSLVSTQIVTSQGCTIHSNLKTTEITRWHINILSQCCTIKVINFQSCMNENSSSTQARWQGHVMTVHTFSNLSPFKTAVSHVCHFCYFIGVTWLFCVVKTAGWNKYAIIILSLPTHFHIAAQLLGTHFLIINHIWALSKSHTSINFTWPLFMWV
jgi:hypothetical protein